MANLSFPPIPTGRPLVALLVYFLIFSLAIPARAQQSSSTPTSGAVSSLPTIVPDSASYSYAGCYNETTGDADAGNLRALSEQGNMVRDLHCFLFRNKKKKEIYIHCYRDGPSPAMTLPIAC